MGAKAALNPVEAAEFLEREFGYVITPKQLAAMRSDGTGPRFHQARRRVSYPISELSSWCGPLYKSTGEARLAKQRKA